jgi:hypothetical protein
MMMVVVVAVVVAVVDYPIKLSQFSILHFHPTDQSEFH